MPEGDTIFRAARTLDRALAGKLVTRFRSVLPALDRIDQDAPLAGRTISSVRSLGKWLLITFSAASSEDLVLLTHMRMNGTWHIYRPGERWQKRQEHMRVLIETADFVAVGFNLPVAEFHTAASLSRHPQLARLGADLLSTGFDAGDALRRLTAQPDLEVGAALLNQSIMAGAGNVYKSEVCFLARVNPFTKVGDLPASALPSLIDIAARLLRANVADGTDAGIVTYFGFRRTTGRADGSARLWVYGRRGQPCRRCATPIRGRKQGAGARVTFWCPQCQPFVSRSRSLPENPLAG